MLSFALPGDVVAWTCVILAVLVFVFARHFKRVASAPALLGLVALGAFLSWAYFEFYLGGGPRIIDATAYLLEARTFARGAFSFEVPDPSASFRGRFLIHTAEDAQRLAPIFPPGYPALLALAVRLGSFKLLGPLLAAALVYVTYRLALSLTGRKRDALVAATFSVLCACLRYHTAETMSHGAATLLTALCTWASVEIIRAPAASLKKLWLLLGFSLGALVATRQLTGIIVGFSCAISLGWTHLQAKPNTSQKQAALTLLVPRFALFALATLPGIALLLAHHHAVSGNLFTSPQTLYYSLADGPADCFGLGLGKGCHYEHADVVAQQGGHGLTLFWALKNTLHRLHWHSLDIANFEPLILVALFTAWKLRKRASYRPLLLLLLCLPLGYAFFYFNGSYPAGGARFFSELLPLWHVLLAVGLRRLRIVPLGIGASLLGFALHGSISHRLLLSPHFGPNTANSEQIAAELDRLAPTNTTGTTNKNSPALVFFSSAHLFNTSALSSGAFTAARRTRDSREAYLVSSLKNSSAWIYESHGDAFTLTPWTNPLGVKDDCSLTLEAEFDYPLLNASQLWAHPEHIDSKRAPSGRALRLHVAGDQPRLTLETLPGDYQVRLVTLDSVGLGAVYNLGRSNGGRIEIDLHRDTPTISVASAFPPPVPVELTHIDKLLLTPAHCAAPPSPPSPPPSPTSSSTF